MEEEEFEILPEEPEEGASQDPSPDGSGGIWLLSPKAWHECFQDCPDGKPLSFSSFAFEYRWTLPFPASVELPLIHSGHLQKLEGAHIFQSELVGLREDEGTPQTLRLILVGKSGSGKSATGNSILGRRVFDSKLSARPVTQAFQQGGRAWEWGELQVIDTPDILSRWAAPQGTAQAVGEAGACSPTGPHVVLLVTQLGRFTEEDQKVARRLEEVFGVGILARTVLVFTRNEDLDGGSLETYLRETDNRALAELDVVCARRHCGFNNKGEGAEQEAQLRELMRHVEVVLWEHEDGPYSPPAAPHPCAAPRESWGLWRLGAEEGRGDQSWLRGLRSFLKEPKQAGGQLPPSAPI